MYRFIFDEIYSKINEYIEDNVAALSHGQPQSIEEYREMVGRIAGMREMLQQVQDVQEMLQKQEEDDT